MELTSFAFDFPDSIFSGFQRLGDQFAGLSAQLGRFVDHLFAVEHLQANFIDSRSQFCLEK